MTSVWTIALQIINFLALVWLLHRFLYRPVLATIAERKQRAEEAGAKVETARAEAERLRAATVAERAGLAAEREREVAAGREEAAKVREELVAGARTEAARIVADGHAALDSERAVALSELETRATELALAIARDLLERIGDAAIDDAVLARIEAELDRLPRERARGLATEAASGIEVVTAHPLAAEVSERWRRRLRDRLGDAARPTFSVDPDLIAGAELHFRTAVVRASWRDALDHAGDTLRAHAAAS